MQSTNGSGSSDGSNNNGTRQNHKGGDLNVQQSISILSQSDEPVRKVVPDDRFSTDEPTYRSVGVVDRRVATLTEDFGKFHLPKKLPVGGVFEKAAPSKKSAAAVDEPAAGGVNVPSGVNESGGGRGYRRSHSAGEDVFLNSSSTESLQSSSLLLGEYNSSCRLHLVDVELPKIVQTVKCCLEAISCDFDFNHKKCKWKCVMSTDCNFLQFVGQVYSGPKSSPGSFVFEAARREGDSILFRRVFESLKNSLDAACTGKAFVPTEIKDGRTPLPQSLKSNAKSTPIDKETLAPLEAMAGSFLLDEKLLAAQAAAKLMASEEVRSVVRTTHLLKLLVSSANGINLGKPKPYERGILRYVTAALARCSEDIGCCQHLAESGAVGLCFRLAAGVSEGKPVGSSPAQEWSIYDIEARREAARCLANLLENPAYLDVLKASVTDARELESWCDIARHVTDERLRVQCKRIESHVS